MPELGVQFGGLTRDHQIVDGDGGKAGDAVEPSKGKVGVQTSWCGIALIVN